MGLDAQPVEDQRRRETGGEHTEHMMRRLILTGACLLGCACAVYAADDYRGTLKGFTFDVPNKNGERYAFIEGGDATMIPGGLVEISGIKTKIFCEDGREVVITSDRGTFNKKTKEVKTDAFVTVVSKDIKITGTGCQWNPNNKLIEIRENVKVEMTVDTQGKGF
jgi:hypothetical protein